MIKLSTSLLLIAVIAAVAGCGDVPPNPTKDTVLQSVRRRAILGQHGIHPVVKRWYYDLHPHAFKCADDPYDCASCPVGPPDRVINIPDRSKAYDVPTQVNAFFACDDINMLVPEPEKYNGHDVFSDVFLCARRPADGYILIDGQKISCSGQDMGRPVNLGTIEPGETKSLTIPLETKP